MPVEYFVTADTSHDTCENSNTLHSTSCSGIDANCTHTHTHTRMSTIDQNRRPQTGGDFFGDRSHGALQAPGTTSDAANAVAAVSAGPHCILHTEHHHRQSRHNCCLLLLHRLFKSRQAVARVFHWPEFTCPTTLRATTSTSAQSQSTRPTAQYSRRHRHRHRRRRRRQATLTSCPDSSARSAPSHLRASAQPRTAAARTIGRTDRRLHRRRWHADRRHLLHHGQQTRVLQPTDHTPRCHRVAATTAVAAATNHTHLRNGGR